MARGAVVLDEFLTRARRQLDGLATAAPSAALGIPWRPKGQAKEYHHHQD
jgi:hypothetical protein